jgi:hypothetical protein
MSNLSEGGGEGDLQVRVEEIGYMKYIWNGLILEDMQNELYLYFIY